MTGADSAPSSLPARPDCRAHKPRSFCRRRSGQRDTTQEQLFDVEIHYPYHPRAGERVTVVRSVRHRGRLHFSVDFPDGTRGLLPAWMTQCGGVSRFPLVDLPRFPITALRALRALIDRLPISSASLTDSRKDAIDDRATGKATAVRPSSQGCDNGRVPATGTRDPSHREPAAQTAPRRMRRRREAAR